MTPKYVKHERIWLKSDPTLSEQWLQDRIAEDPSIVGLGDLTLIDRERRQERAGRLDLLLSDIEQGQRFEVELMLGATDESHIVRCIEYWDIERRRYPGYDHYAVIIAEDITSRFLNVLALFSGSIPLIAIQLSAILIGDQVTLHFSKVLDQRLLRVEDDDSGVAQVTDRAYWESRGSRESVVQADQLLSILNEVASKSYELNYNKHYIGLTDGNRSTNFLVAHPRRKYLRASFYLRDADPYIDRCEEVGLSADKGRKGQLRVNLSPSNMEEHGDLIRELVTRTVEEHEA